jgi:hypothetical protein
MLAHVHIQKTAGQTIRAILRKNFGPAHCDLFKDYGDLEQDWKWTVRCYRRLKSIAGHAVRPTPAFEKHFPQARYYTFLRDPLRRCISHYQFILQSGVRCGPFRQWVESNADHQTRMIAGEPNAEKAIELVETRIGFVGLVERFDESLVLWKRWTGMAQIDIGYRAVNVARSNAVRENVLSDDRTGELIRDLHQEDAKLYRHVVEELYPRQVAAYGETLQDEVRSFERTLATGANSSWVELLGKAKRNLIYKPVMRLVNSGRKAA